jgi:hypothetical protein
MKNLYDRVVIEFQKNDQSVVSAALSDTDLDLLQNMHGQEKHVIISMVFQEMEESLKERISNPVPTPEIEK